MKDDIKMALLFPLLSIIVVVVFGGALGIIFMLLDETALGGWAVVIAGMALVIVVPSGAALLEWLHERNS